MIPSRSSNTSRAYWELRAEQIMDRVFMPAPAASPPQAQVPARAPAQEDDSIEVEVRDAPPAAAPPRRPQAAKAWLSTPWQIAGATVSPKLALACSGGLACLALACSATLWLGWSQASSDLRQERTIRLIEGIRGLGPGDARGNAAAAGPTGAKSQENADGLPPPPPSEPWIEELGQLDGQSQGPTAAAPLQVPVNGTLRAPAPQASGPTWAGPLTPPPPVPAGGTPELVGVVQIPGKPGSAIFQVGGNSTNASAGESIGSSGWRLLSTNGDSAVIERAGVRRSVSISSGF